MSKRRKNDVENVKFIKLHYKKFIIQNSSRHNVAACADSRNEVIHVSHIACCSSSQWNLTSSD